MEVNELLMAQNEQIQDLNHIVETYRSIERKSKIILEVLLVISIIALYWFLSDFLGGVWGYIFTFAIIGIGFFCIETLNISFANAPISDGKLAYRACVAMDALIQIKEGTYATYDIHIITVGQGKHLSLYERFSLLYPECKSKHLKNLSKISISYEDMK